MRNPISRTAVLTARGRALAGIPFADSIYRKSGCADLAPQLHIDGAAYNRLAVRMLARYYQVISVFEQSGCKQFVEIGSGLSPLGLIISKNPAINVIVTDLPDMSALQAEVFGRILPNPRDNLHAVPADVLENGSMAYASGDLKPNRPVFVCIEGVLPYFTAAERMVALRNIALHLLRPCGGGQVIVVDAPCLSCFTRAQLGTFQAQSAAMASEVGRNMAELAFKSPEKAAELFAPVGFESQWLRGLDLAPQVSARAMELHVSAIDSVSTLQSFLLKLA